MMRGEGSEKKDEQKEEEEEHEEDAQPGDPQGVRQIADAWEVERR